MAKVTVHHSTLGAELFQTTKRTAAWPPNLAIAVADPDTASLELFFLLLFATEYVVSLSVRTNRDLVLASFYGAATSFMGDGHDPAIRQRHLAYAAALNHLPPGKGLGDMLASSMLKQFLLNEDIRARMYVATITTDYMLATKDLLDAVDVL